SPSRSLTGPVLGARRRHPAPARTLNPRSRPMRNLLSSLARDSGHVSQKPLLTRSFPMRRRFFVLTLLACCVPVAGFADGRKYAFTSLDFPGATDTNSFDINNAGTIVGYFTDTSGVIHGYIWSGGVFTQVDGPGAIETRCFGINDAGTVVGYYSDSLGFH